MTCDTGIDVAVVIGLPRELEVVKGAGTLPVEAIEKLVTALEAGTLDDSGAGALDRALDETGADERPDVARGKLELCPPCKEEPVS